MNNFHYTRLALEYILEHERRLPENSARTMAYPMSMACAH